jgi:hypothetical protein
LSFAVRPLRGVAAERLTADHRADRVAVNINISVRAGIDILRFATACSLLSRD